MSKKFIVKIKTLKTIKKVNSMSVSVRFKPIPSGPILPPKDDLPTFIFNHERDVGQIGNTQKPDDIVEKLKIFN